VTTALGLTAAVLLAALGVLAWARPTLLRLALRNALRRKADALLVVLGCGLGTAIITGSLLVGDTLDASMRAEAPERLGPIDVVVTSYGAPIADGVEATLTQDPPRGADGVLPASIADASLATPEDGEGQAREREVLPAARLIEVDFAKARNFGGDPAATGIFGPTPQPGTVALGRDAAEELGVGPGDSVEVYAYGQYRLLRVDRILPRLGVAGYASGFDSGSMNAFVAPGTIEELAYSPSTSKNSRPPERLTFVSAAGGVFAGGEAARSGALADRLGERLNTLPGHEIEAVKRDLLREAREEGDSFAELFLSLGAFAVLAGVALLVNALVALSEERRRELGVLRSLGLSRGGLVGAFVLEGALYAAPAAILGTLAGVGVARLIVMLAGGIFSSQRGGVETLRFGVEPATLLAGLLSGLLVSLAVVALTALWTSRMTVVAAMGDLARRADRPPKAWPTALGAVGAVACAGASAWAFAAGDDLGRLALTCLVILCLAVVATRFVARRSPERRALRAGIVSGAAVLAALWVVLAFVVLDLDGGDVSLFVIQGLVLILAAVVLLGQHQARVGSALLRLAGGSGLVPRLALAYPTARRFRTGTTLLAYGLIVFVLVFSSVLSAVFSAQERDLISDEGGGFDVLVSTGSADPVSARELESQAGVERVATLDWNVAGFRVGPSGPFEDWAVSGFDRALLDGGPPALEDFDRERYPNEKAVWEAALNDPSLAIADVTFLEQGGGPPEGNVAVGDEIAVRSPTTGETVKRRVVAISSAGVGFSGVMLSKDSLGKFVESPVGNRHYLSVSDGADPGAVAARLERGFLPNGLEARSFGEVVDEALRSQEAFFDLIEGYLALGLFIGIAGLGVATVRAARERRGAVGVLRALGLPAPAVRAAVLAESGLLAVEGVLVGAVLALVTSYGLVRGSDAFGKIEVAFVVPWGQLALLVAAVLGASLAVALPAATRAAATPPAASLRTADA
jgi:putative ABC transport system permease protein